MTTRKEKQPATLTTRYWEANCSPILGSLVGVTQTQVEWGRLLQRHLEISTDTSMRLLELARTHRVFDEVRSVVNYWWYATQGGVSPMLRLVDPFRWRKGITITPDLGVDLQHLWGVKVPEQFQAPKCRFNWTQAVQDEETA